MTFHAPSRREPSWILKDPGSFASIHVKLPPGTAVNCESDAVVTFSQKVRVRGVMSGGFFAGLARAFLTRESFFTTLVENTDPEGVADVMMAPKDPGGVVLHRLTMEDRGLLLTSGAYIASDADVQVTSQVQTRISNSFLSGTGFFLLKASGRGYVACGAYGAVHKYTLKEGETRVVDNGHLIAWSATMKYSVGLASGRGRIFNSMASGEGLMCFFEGPGVVYVQSHKPELFGTVSKGASPAAKPVYPCCSFFLGVVMLFIFLTLLLLPFVEVAWSWEEVEEFLNRRERQWRNGEL
jgi:uncharacterized protein (TIGR00266 family)